VRETPRPAYARGGRPGGDAPEQGPGAATAPTLRDEDGRFLDVAIEEARTGMAEGGIPIGAALVVDRRVLGAGHNRRVQEGSVIRHGEMDALENAGRQPADIYHRSSLYTTLSPCHMCTGAILLYGIRRVVIGENRTYRNGEELLREHGVEVIVADSAVCLRLMGEFVRAHPDLWNEDIGVEA
jgi:creatinine deaminase